MEKQVVRVLIVDDDPNLLSTLSDILEAKGFENVLAPTGAEALLQVEQRPPDVALIDLQLGDIPGLEVLRGIKQRSPQTECILLTGHASQATAIEAVNLGAYSYFQKPYDIDQLLLSIRHAIEKCQAGKALAESQARYRTFINATTDMAFLKDDQFRYLIVNEAASRFFGKPIAEIIGKDDFELLPEAAAQIIRRDDKQVLQVNKLVITVEEMRGRVYEFREFPVDLQDGRMGVGGYIRDITESRRAEMALRESEAQYRLLADHMTDTIWLMDMNLRTIYVTPSVIHQRGYSLDEINSIPLDQQMTPDSLNHVMQLFAEIANLNPSIRLDQPFSASAELELVRKDGSKLWVDSTFTLILNPEGQPTNILGTGRDITERKQKERRFQALIEKAPDGIVLVSVEGKFLYASPAARKIFGYGIDETLDTSPVESTHPDDLPTVLNALSNLIQNPTETSTLLYRFKHRDGSWRWIESAFSNLLSEPGVEAIVINFRDITERKQAEDALIESEERFRSMFAASPEALMLLDPSDPATDWPIVDCNEVACQTNGYTREELIGKSVDILNITKGTPQERSAYLESIRRAGVLHLESFHRHHDGHIFPVEISTSIVTFQGRELVLGIDRDITERKQTEEALIVSEARYRRLFEAAKDGILIMEADTGQIVDVNPFLTDLLGYSREEFIGKELWQLGFFEDIFASKANFLELQQEKYIRYDDLPLVTRHGKHVHVEFVSNVYSVNSHKVVQCNIRDITARKQAEQALAESEARYRGLFEDLPIAIWEEDFSAVKQRLEALKREGVTDFRAYLAGHLEVVAECVALIKVVDVNKAAQAMQQAENKTELLTDLTKILPGETYELFMNELVQIVEGKTQFSWEGINQTLKGNWKTLSLNWVAIPGHENDLSRVIVSMVDITERKRAEDALRVSEERFRSLYENATIGMYRTTPNGRVSMANPVLVRMLGYQSLEELSQRDLSREGYEPAYPRQDFQKRIERDGELTGIESAWKRKDGSTIYVRESARLVQDEDGQPLFYEGTVEDITERKRAEEKLEQERILLRTLIDNLPDRIYVKDVQGHKIISNTADLQASGGKTMIDIIGKTDFDTYPPELAENYWAFDKSVIDSGMPILNYVEPGLDSQGNPVWILSSKVPLRDAQGKVIGLVGVGRDITERRQAEEELRASEQRYQSLIDISPVGIFRTDAAGLTTFVSHYWSKISGLTGEKALGHGWLEAVDPAEHENLLNGWTQVVREKKISNSEYRFLRPDGSSAWVIGQAIPQFNAVGEFIGHIGTITDITTRKRAEELTRRRVAELEVLYESSLAISRLLNPREIAQTMAETLTQKLKWHHAAVRLYHPETSLVELLALHQPQTTSEAISGEIDRLQKTINTPGMGLSGWVIQHGEAVLCADVNADPRYLQIYPDVRSGVYVPMKLGERVLGCISVESTELAAFDEHDLRLLSTMSAQAAIAIHQAQLYEQVKHYAAELEKRVEERTAQLVIAKENAEASNRAKSDFLAVMSHEIRTPLNGVLGLTQLAMQTSLTEQQRGYLANIQVSGENLLSTINDILDFSKIEAGRIILEQVDFNLDTVLQSVSGIVVHKAHEKDLELVFNAAAGIPRLLVGDPLRLGQVLTNLVGNAVKFTEAGEVILKTSLLKKTAHRVVLEFSVSDTGIGMTEAQLAQLFQLFSQADTSTSRKYGGTGLGLTISQRLVNLMGGEISTESRFGQGSTFKFTLTFDCQAGAKYAGFVTVPEIRGLRVLVIDDHVATREFLQSVLESFSIKVTVASSAEAGLAYLLKQKSGRHFDLVLIDWNLPGGMTGLEAIRRIKQHPKLSRTPTILLMNTNEMVNQTAEIEPDGYLIKPITRSQLLDALMLALGKRAQVRTWPEKRLVVTGSLNKLHGRQILLVEDNEINQIVAAEMLQGLGLKVSIANNGEDAIRMLNKGGFDLVLMDIQMPGMDGYQTTAQIRTDPRFSYAKLPIVALTAHALAGDRDKALDAGLNDYVTKPINLAQLTNVLLTWANPHHADSQASVLELESSHDEQVPLPVPAGIDMTDMLERLEGNRALGQRLLRMFRANYAGTVSEIRSGLEQGDLALVRRLVHTLKGVAGNISARALSAAAKTLETNLDVEDHALREKYLLELEQQMEIVVASIAELEQVETPAELAQTSEKIETIPALAARMNELADLLAASDADAANCVAKIVQQTQIPGLRDEFRALESLIGRYDFETALKNLQNLAEKEGIQLRTK